MLLGRRQIREVQPLVILTAMVTLVSDPISYCVPYCLRELTSTLPPLRSGAKKDLLVFATTEALILLNDGTGNFTDLEGDVDFEGYDGTCFDASGDGRMSIWTTQMESNVYYYIARGSWPIELLLKGATQAPTGMRQNSWCPLTWTAMGTWYVYHQFALDASRGCVC